MTAKSGIGSSLAFLPALLLLANSLPAQTCSTENTRGKYLVLCSGYLSPAPKAPLVPAKILGIANADESGNFSGNATVSLGGMGTVTQTVKGTEQLNLDCTGSITYAQTINGQPGPPLDINFIVSEHGDRIDGLATDPGTVLSCELRRLSIFPSSQTETVAPEKREEGRLVSQSDVKPAPPQPQLVSVKPESDSSLTRELP